MHRRSRARSKTPGEGIGVQTFKPLPPQNYPDRVKAYVEKVKINAYGMERQAGLAGGNTPSQMLASQSPFHQITPQNLPQYTQMPRIVTTQNSVNSRPRPMDPRLQRNAVIRNDDRDQVSLLNCQQIDRIGKQARTLQRNNEIRTPFGATETVPNASQTFMNIKMPPSMDDADYFFDNGMTDNRINNQRYVLDEDYEMDEDYNQPDEPPPVSVQLVKAQRPRNASRNSAGKNTQTPNRAQKRRAEEKQQPVEGQRKRAKTPIFTTPASTCPPASGSALAKKSRVPLEVISFFLEQKELARKITKFTEKMPLRCERVKKTQDVLKSFLEEIPR